MLSNISVIQYARRSSSCSIVLCAIPVILCEARAFGLVVVVPEYVPTTSLKPSVVPILDVCQQVIVMLRYSLTKSYLRHMASRFPASVRHPFPYCIIDRTKSACMESREGEFSAASMVASFRLFLKILTSSAVKSWRLVHSKVVAVMAWNTNGRPVSDIAVKPSRHLTNVCWCKRGNQAWYSPNHK